LKNERKAASAIDQRWTRAEEYVRVNVHTNNIENF
jgi:hypothetical protein